MRPTDKRLRIGLVGAGRRGQAHLSTVAALGDRFELVAICDVNEEAARAAAERSDVRAYSDVRAFFSDQRLDVVAIVTPPESHHLIAKVAAEHGVHMLVETPLGTTRAMMDFIIEAADRAGVTVEVAENMRRQPPARLARTAIDFGLIGRVLRVSTWYESIGQQGSYHQMSLLQFYAGAEVAEVRAFSQTFGLDGSLGAKISDEIWTQALLSFPTGALGSCTFVSSWLAPLRRGHPRFVSIEGTEGFITIGPREQTSLTRVENGKQVRYPMKIDTAGDGGQEQLVRFWFDTSPTIEVLNPFADRPLDFSAEVFGPDDGLSRAEEWASIHRAVSTQSLPDYSLAEARRDQELSIAITESARLGGQPLRLPLREETAWESQVHEEFRRRWGGDPFKDVDALITRNFTGGARY